MDRILVGSSEGVNVVGGESLLDGIDVAVLAAHGPDLVAAGGETIVRLEPDGASTECRLEGLTANCVLGARAALFVGTSKARLARVAGEVVTMVEGFDAIPSRNEWYTPWGGPADVRSLAEDAAGDLFANVHVGGIVVSRDRGETWTATTLDIDADVHQVTAHPTRPGMLYAATAYGLATTADGGRTWESTSEGLDEQYCRAVAISGDTLLITAAQSFRGNDAAIYRRPLAGPAAPFERCRKGLPDHFDHNIDTHCVAAAGSTVVFGTADGEVYRSEDEGVTWEQIASDLPAVQAVVVLGG